MVVLESQLTSKTYSEFQFQDHSWLTLETYSSSGLWWTLKTYGNSRVTVNLESILRISGSQLTLKTYKEFQDHNWPWRHIESLKVDFENTYIVDLRSQLTSKTYSEFQFQDHNRPWKIWGSWKCIENLGITIDLGNILRISGSQLTLKVY